MKRILLGLLAGALLVGVLAACGGKGSAGSASGERKSVTFWYENSGKEAEVYEAAIKAYNESQTRYQVQGLSVNDSQKLIVAMSSNEAPDVIKVSNQAIVQYQKNKLVQSLQGNIDKDKLDLSMYSRQAVNANTVDGAVCALPLSAYTIQMFYNKDLLKAAGFSEPPKTVDEMYQMAVAGTVVDASGKITTLGYPLFPLASARQELVYAFGGRWWDENSKPTPDNSGNVDSLTMNMKYRQKYGVDAVSAFVATANTNRYTEQDMFFAGKQLFRLDGSWLPTMMKKFDSKVNYGITLIPGTKANPALRGTSRFETDSVGIPAMAKEKGGAWDFAKWLCSEKGAKIINLGTGTLPSVKALYEDKDLLAAPGIADFIAALKEEKGIQYPQMKDTQEYISLINSTLDQVYSGKAAPAAAMAHLKELAANLK